MGGGTGGLVDTDRPLRTGDLVGPQRSLAWLKAGVGGGATVLGVDGCVEAATFARSSWVTRALHAATLLKALCDIGETGGEGEKAIVLANACVHALELKGSPIRLCMSVKIRQVVDRFADMTIAS